MKNIITLFLILWIAIYHVDCKVKVIVWGRNDQGQLGLGHNTHVGPTMLPFEGALEGKTIERVSTGISSSILLTDDGDLLTTGSNVAGQLGNNDSSITKRNRFENVALTNEMKNTTVTNVFSNYALFALLNNNDILGAGANQFLGNGQSSGKSYVFGPVTKTASWNNKTISQIALGIVHGLAMLSDSKIVGWGFNLNGAIGDGTTNPRYTAVDVDVPDGSIPVKIFATHFSSFILATNGRLYSFGENFYGGLCTESSNDRELLPTRIDNKFTQTIYSIAGGNGHTVLLSDFNYIRTCGKNDYGQLGIQNLDTTRNIQTPQVLGSINILKIAAGEDHSMFLSSKNELYGWGQNTQKQVAPNLAIRVTVPLKIQIEPLIGRKIQNMTLGGASNFILTTPYECFGKNNDTDTVCHGHGICIETDVCQCDTGYKASNCSEFLCNSKSLYNSNVCSGHGNCVAPDHCECQATYGGNDCQLPKCYGDANVATTCNGHGTCASPDNCQCDSNYIGKNCSIPICFGIPQNESSTCSGHGSCSKPNTCVCTNGYGLNNCSVVTCNSIPKTSTNVCSGNGLCTGINTCSCETNYFGNFCNVTTCQGVFSNTSSVCSSHGNCSSHDTCICQSGYAGANCSDIVCFGIYPNNATVCSSNGTCVGPNQCQCSSKYAGQSCNLKKCYGITETDNAVCSGHGTCTNVDTCTCDSNYKGDQCGSLKTYYCYGNIYSSTNVCSSHGKCVETDKCACDAYYTLKNCSGVNHSIAPIDSFNTFIWHLEQKIQFNIQGPINRSFTFQCKIGDITETCPTKMTMDGNFLVIPKKGLSHGITYTIDVFMSHPNVSSIAKSSVQVKPVQDIPITNGQYSVSPFFSKDVMVCGVFNITSMHNVQFNDSKSMAGYEYYYSIGDGTDFEKIMNNGSHSLIIRVPLTEGDELLTIRQRIFNKAEPSADKNITVKQNLNQKSCIVKTITSTGEEQTFFEDKASLDTILSEISGDSSDESKVSEALALMNVLSHASNPQSNSDKKSLAEKMTNALFSTTKTTCSQFNYLAVILQNILRQYYVESFDFDYFNSIMVKNENSFKSSLFQTCVSSSSRLSNLFYEFMGLYLKNYGSFENIQSSRSLMATITENRIAWLNSLKQLLKHASQKTGTFGELVIMEEAKDKFKGDAVYQVTLQIHEKTDSEKSVFYNWLEISQNDFISDISFILPDSTLSRSIHQSQEDTEVSFILNGSYEEDAVYECKLYDIRESKWRSDLCTLKSSSQSTSRTCGCKFSDSASGDAPPLADSTSSDYNNQPYYVAVGPASNSVTVYIIIGVVFGCLFLFVCIMIILFIVILILCKIKKKRKSIAESTEKIHVEPKSQQTQDIFDSEMPQYDDIDSGKPETAVQYEEPNLLNDIPPFEEPNSMYDNNSGYNSYNNNNYNNNYDNNSQYNSNQYNSNQHNAQVDYNNYTPEIELQDQPATTSFDDGQFEHLPPTLSHEPPTF